MENKNQVSSNFIIGDFTVVGSRNLVQLAKGETVITPKMLQVLTELAKHQGQTCSKEQLLQAVWGTLHTSDMVLSRAISDLRKVFGDSAKEQKFIETVSKQGYRLIPEVIWQRNDDALSQLHEIDNNRQMATETNDVVETQKSYVNGWKFSWMAACVFFVFVAYWLINGTQTSGAQDGLFEQELNYLTSDEQTKRFVRVSKDGKYLAYVGVDKTQPSNQVWLHSLSDNKRAALAGSGSTSNSHQLMSWSASPAFSHDGKRVAFKYFSKSGCFVRITELATKTYRDIAECPSSKTDALDWSSDGRYLITTVFNRIKKIEGLALIDTDNGNIDILPAPEVKASGYLWPRFSPDVSKIAAVYFQPNRNLWTIGYLDLLQNSFIELKELGQEVSQVVWDETGQAIYYLIIGGTKAGVWRLELKNNETSHLVDTNSSSLDYDLKNRQFVVIEREKQQAIWYSTRDKLGQVSSAPLFKSLMQTRFPSLSPDGESLAFVSTSKGLDSLWRRYLSSNKVVLLYQADKIESLSEPSWSPDGRQLTVSVLAKDSSRVIEFDLELGDIREMDRGNNVKMAKWSPDGTAFYWYEQLDDSWYVMRKDLETSKVQTVLKQPISRFEVSAGHQLHYQKIGSFQVLTRKLKNLNLGTDLGQVQMRDSLLLDLKTGFEWHVQGDMIYYVSLDTANKKFGLYKKSLKTADIEGLYPVSAMTSADTGRHLTVNKAGNIAYYTKLERYQTDVALIKSK